MTLDRDDARGTKGRLSNKFWDQSLHDLHQPVQALQLLTKLLSRHVPDGDSDRSIQYIYRSLDSLTEMNEAMVRLGRLATGHDKPRPKWLNTAEIINLVRSSLNAVAHEQDGVLQTGPLPGSLHADAEWLKMTLEGMLEFAVQQCDGITLSIHGNNGRHGDSLTIEFRAPDFVENRADQVFYDVPRPNGGTEGHTVGLGPGYLRELCALLGQRLELVAMDDGWWQMRLFLPHGPA